MGASDDQVRRFREAGKAMELYATGDDQGVQQQSKVLIDTIRALWDGGFERGNMVVQLLVGAAFFADNLGIPREDLIDALRRVGPPSDSEVKLYAPGGSLIRRG
jgi:hypothetical protein